MGYNGEWLVNNKLLDIYWLSLYIITKELQASTMARPDKGFDK